MSNAKYNIYTYSLNEEGNFHVNGSHLDAVSTKQAHYHMKALLQENPSSVVVAVGASKNELIDPILKHNFGSSEEVGVSYMEFLERTYLLRNNYLELIKHTLIDRHRKLQKS